MKKLIEIALLVVLAAVFIGLGGNKIYKNYITNHNTTGKIIDVQWKCWSCNTVTGVNDVATTADLDRTTSGYGRVAHCFTPGNVGFAHNNSQLVTFFIILSTPLGTKVVEYSWRRRYVSTEDFDLPADLPPKGESIRIRTTLAGQSAEWIDFKEKE